MSKIVFFCIPAHGHTNPTLEVVRELIERGHEVWYYSYEHFREKIERTGARFIPCDGYDAEMKLTKEQGARLGWDLGLSTSVLVRTTLALDEMVCQEMEKLKPDCIVADSMAVWGRFIALKLGIPFVSSTTTFAFNRYSAKIMKQSPVQAFGMIFSMPKISRELKKLQEKGYPVDNVLSIIQNDNDTNTIVYTSREFQPCAETFSEKYHFVGPSIRGEEKKTGMGSEMENPEVLFARSDRQKVYISMGTVNNRLVTFYKSCIAALKDSGYEVLMSVGDTVDIEMLKQETMEHITIVPHVDQIRVLQSADVFLTHCGMNSTSESLYYKVPLVMYPQTPEQGAVARRVEQMGAGILLEKADKKAIGRAIKEVLENPSYEEKASALCAGFHAAGGARAAADAIEKVCVSERKGSLSGDSY